MDARAAAQRLPHCPGHLVTAHPDSPGGTMRVVRYYEHGDPSVLRVEDAPKPEAGPGEVLIRAEGMGVNSAAAKNRRGLPTGGPAPPPAAPAGDVAGVVEAIGPGVTNVAVGDRVVAPV